MEACTLYNLLCYYTKCVVSKKVEEDVSFVNPRKGSVKELV